MDMNSVAVFVKVVQAGSFSEAARRLNMPKTTVSARVAALEAALGVNLIQRTTRKLNVTEAGKRYFNHCAAAMQQLEAGKAALESESSHPQGTLRVTAPVDLACAVLPKIIHKLLETSPLLRVELLVSNRVMDLVGEGIDLAIRAGPMKDSSLVTKRFFEPTANLWATPQYLTEVGNPKTPAELVKRQLIGLGGLMSFQLFKGKAVADMSLAGRVRCDDFSVIKEMVLLGKSIAWLPNFLVVNEASNGLLVPVLPGWTAKLEGNINFVYPGLKRGSTNVRAFMEAAQAVIETMDGIGRAH